MTIHKRLYLLTLVFLACTYSIQGMEPLKEPRKYVFKWQNTEAMRRVLHTMISDLPAMTPGEFKDKKAYINKFKPQLEAISALIQIPLFDPGTIIAELIKRRGLGNILYDIARIKNHQETINWLAQQNLVNFAIAIGNDSTYEINVSSIGRVREGIVSNSVFIHSLKFPLTFQGYGEVWGKLITERKLERNELIREIVKLNLPSNAIIKISINLTGKTPPYTIELSFSNLKKEEMAKKHHLGTDDPLDVFELLKYHKLTEASRSTRWNSYLTADEILNWPDVTKPQDQSLNEVALTRIPSGRYTRKDIYRYILNLTKDNYTPQDIQSSFDRLVQEIGKKYVPGWPEYIRTHGEIASGPFGLWRAIGNWVPIDKNTVIANALRILKKAYQNLMVDKGVNVGE